MNVCPQCRRRLLSHASAKCNWCGVVIRDAQYQAQAQIEREAYFVHQAEHDAQSLSSIDAININANDPFIPSPFARPVRLVTAVRPLTYENQPQSMCSVEQMPSTVLVAAETGSGNAASLPATDPIQAEAEQSGRFQHLEL